jgi:hypothetical protein
MVAMMPTAAAAWSHEKMCVALLSLVIQASRICALWNGHFKIAGLGTSAPTKPRIKFPIIVSHYVAGLVHAAMKVNIGDGE